MDTSMVITAALVLLMLTVTPAVSGLQCLECLSDCQDPANHQVEKCDADVDYCLRLKDGGEITLSCAPDPPTNGDHCRQNGDTIQCYCDTDMCNEATSLLSHSLATIIMAAAARLML